MEEMYLDFGRCSTAALACLLAAACSRTPTTPSATASGPLISPGPLVGLIPQGPPPVPERIAGPIPSALGATRFVALGDSITYGTLSAYDGSFLYDVPSWSYPVRVKLALDQFHAGNSGSPRVYSVENAGIPGENASDGARRVQSVINQFRPQGLLLLEGINDLGGGRSVDQAVSSLEAIINIARSPTNNVTVLIATMPQTYDTCRPPDLGGECRDNSKGLIVEFNNRLRQMASGRQNVYVVDLYNSFGTDHRYIGADGLHPNEAGYARMASTFLGAIETVFGIRGSFQ
jgi:lysophospholipase L1-like esterase